MTDKLSNPTAEAMKKALASKREAGGPSFDAGFKSDRHSERGASLQNAALNKPAFRRASKRG